MANKTNSTKVVTGVVRLSYANVWEPASVNGSNPKYSVSLIIPKEDKATIDAINRAVENAIKIDSLESSLTRWKLYSENLARVLSGDKTINLDSLLQDKAPADSLAQ